LQYFGVKFWVVFIKCIRNILALVNKNVYDDNKSSKRFLKKLSKLRSPIVYSHKCGRNWKEIRKKRDLVGHMCFRIIIRVSNNLEHQ
jgi:hypothetical protein